MLMDCKEIKMESNQQNNIFLKWSGPYSKLGSKDLLPVVKVAFQVGRTHSVYTLTVYTLWKDRWGEG